MITRGIQFGFLIYWLAFVLFTVHQGQYPGFFDDPDRGSYPYSAVAQVALLLSLFLVVLYLIVPAARFPYSQRRLGFAAAYALVLFVASYAFSGTDQPAYYYVPLTFATVTLGAVGIIAVVSVVYGLNRRRGASA